MNNTDWRLLLEHGKKLTERSPNEYHISDMADMIDNSRTYSNIKGWEFDESPFGGGIWSWRDMKSNYEISATPDWEKTGEIYVSINTLTGDFVKEYRIKFNLTGDIERDVQKYLLKMKPILMKWKR